MVSHSKDIGGQLASRFAWLDCGTSSQSIWVTTFPDGGKGSVVPDLFVGI